VEIVGALVLLLDSLCLYLLSNESLIERQNNVDNKMQNVKYHPAQIC